MNSDRGLGHVNRRLGHVNRGLLPRPLFISSTDPTLPFP